MIKPLLLFYNSIVDAIVCVWVLLWFWAFSVETHYVVCYILSENQTDESSIPWASFSHIYIQQCV